MNNHCGDKIFTNADIAALKARGPKRPRDLRLKSVLCGSLSPIQWIT